MKIDVPVYKQDHHLACGAAALRMVMAYYGVKVTEKEIIKSMKWVKWKGEVVGLHGTDLGIFAMKRGFKVTGWAYCTEFLDPKISRLSKKLFIKELEKEIKKEKKEVANSLRSVIKFIKAGGKYYIKIPDIELIKEQIRKKVPVILNVRLGILYKKKSASGHYLVVTGYDKNWIYYNDPHTGKTGKTKIKDFLYAWHANAHDSTEHMTVITR